METAYEGIMFLWRFTDIGARGNEITIWRVGDTEHVPWKRVPCHLPRTLQIPYTHCVSAHAGQKTTTGGDRHADVWPQVCGDASYAIAPTTYLRARAGVIHHELPVGEVVGDDVRAVLGPFQRMRSLLDLERGSAGSQVPYLYANTTRCEPRVVGGESYASVIPLSRLEHTNRAPIRGVPHLQTIRHVLPLERIRQKARTTAKVDDTETTADGGSVERMLDLACVGVPE